MIRIVIDAGWEMTNSKLEKLFIRDFRNVNRVGRVSDLTLDRKKKLQIHASYRHHSTHVTCDFN